MTETRDNLEGLIRQVASEIDISEGFRAEQGRDLNDDEQTASEQVKYLAVKWTSTQPVSRFVDEEQEDNPDETRRERRRRERREHRQHNKEFKRCRNECRAYVKANWVEIERTAIEHLDSPARWQEARQSNRNAGEGVGFIFALISAVIWHLIIVLIVRWIIRRYFDDPELAEQICLPG